MARNFYKNLLASMMMSPKKTKTINEAFDWMKNKQTRDGFYGRKNREFNIHAQQVAKVIQQSYDVLKATAPRPNVTTQIPPVRPSVTGTGRPVPTVPSSTPKAPEDGKTHVPGMHPVAVAVTRIADQNLIGKSVVSVRPLIGSLQFFYYDPKWADTLPYYDTFPLVMPLKIYPDGFLGLNFHYLDMPHRAALLDIMDSTFQRNPMGNMQVSYELMKVIPRDKAWQFCLKRYLTSHIQSGFAPIKPEDWEKCLFLPVAQFQKKTERFVWNQAQNYITGMHHDRL